MKTKASPNFFGVGKVLEWIGVKHCCVEVEEKGVAIAEGGTRECRTFLLDGGWVSGWEGGWLYSGLHAPGPLPNSSWTASKKPDSIICWCSKKIWDWLAFEIWLASPQWFIFTFQFPFILGVLRMFIYCVRFGLVWLMTWIFYTGRWLQGWAAF